MMVPLLRDQIGKMLTKTRSSTPLTLLSGNSVRMTMTALLDTSVLVTCGLITANMRLPLDAGKKQFALETELTGNSMKDPSSGSVTPSNQGMPLD